MLIRTELQASIVTYIFVAVIYVFIFLIIRMISKDIRTMYRKKTGDIPGGAYLKLINLRQELNYSVEESYEITDDEIIGRSRKCDIVISDKYLSSKHLRIFKVSGKFFLEDLGSTNGTFLNGNELGEKAVELLDGDKISFGRTNFLFVLPVKKS